VSGLLTPDEVRRTAAWIASVQLPNGMIPWYPGGHADPWNHVEAAMALAVAGHEQQATLAYEWLARAQHDDGSWCHYYLADGVEDPRKDPNACAYLAAGLWWHYLLTGDRDLLGELYPVVAAALQFVVALQRTDGSVRWSLDADGVAGRYALLTATASIRHSLRCGAAIAAEVGAPRRDVERWLRAAERAGRAVRDHPDAFADKGRWAMDWYYPVLAGALYGIAARRRLVEGWGRFVIPGLGVRCVADRAWVTAAETSECAIAFEAAGLHDAARRLAGWTRHLRDRDGAYWTGCVHPQCVRFPGGERSTYTAAAVVLADHVLADASPAAAVFRDARLVGALHPPGAGCDEAAG
jgi:hypothetical protein